MIRWCNQKSCYNVMFENMMKNLNGNFQSRERLQVQKSFRDKVALPLVNKLKELVKSLTIQCVRLKEEVLQLRDKVKHLTSDVEFYKGKIRDMSAKTEVLQEKADDLERVKRYAGAEQIDTIISNVKEQERMEQQARQYHRSYGAR